MVAGAREISSQSADIRPVVQVYTLGGFRVLVRGRQLDDQAWRRKTARQLFKILLTRPNRRMTRDEIFELLWPESDPDAAAINLRSTLHAMRRALETPEDDVDLVLGDRDSLWLRPGLELWIDADAFEHAVELAHQAPDAVPLLEQASGAYQGDYLPEDLYEDWSMQRRDALKRAWIDVQFELATNHVERGQPELAIAQLQKLLAAEQTDERAAQELMRLLLQLRRRPEALRVFQNLEQALREELGVEPSEASRELQRQAAASPAPAASSASFHCAYTFPDPKQLVGRDVELNRLLALLQRGRTAGQAVLISAPAGTGKSTLAGALLKAARRSGVLCLAGAAYDEHAAVPLAAFQEAFTDFVLAASSNPLDTTIAMAATDLIYAVRDLRQGPEASGSSTGGAPVERTRLFAAMLTLLRRLADKGPVLVCLEDIHAADEATLQLLHYLLRQTRQSPVTFVITFRAEALVPGEPLHKLVAGLIREELAERFELAPLDQRSTDQLAALLLGGPPPGDLSGSLYRVTEGNPLFVEQVVLTLREQGRLDTDIGNLGPTIADASSLSLVVRELVEGRLTHLRPRGRETLEVAAVLGQAFEYTDLLAVVDPPDEATLLTDLDEAIRAQLIRERPTGFAFSHSLLREGMYWALSRPRRMLLHTRVGDVLERRAGANARDISAELAYHFLSGGLARSVQERAIQYSIYAGQHATALTSHREALHHFEVACDLIQRTLRDADAETRAAVYEGLGLAQRATGQYQAAMKTFETVLDVALDPCVRARARRGLSFAANHLGDTTRAQAEAEAGLSELNGAPGRQAAIERLILQHQLAWLRFLLGRYADVLRLGLSMLQLANELNEGQWFPWAQTIVGAAHTGSGRTRLALEQYELMLARGEQGATNLDMARNRTNLGLENYRAGHFDTARGHLERAVTLYRESFSEARAILALQGLGWVHLAQADPRRAQEYADLSVGIARETKDRWLAESLQLSGELARLREQWDTARASVEEALAIHQQVGHASRVVESLVQLGRVAEDSDDLSAARQQYLSALRVADQMDPAPSVAAAHRSFGLLALRSGDSVMASEHIRHAVSLVHEMTGTLEYPQTLLALMALERYSRQPEEALATTAHALAAPHAAAVGVELHVARAELLIELERPREAAAHALTARTIAEELLAPRLIELARGLEV